MENGEKPNGEHKVTFETYPGAEAAEILAGKKTPPTPTAPAESTKPSGPGGSTGPASTGPADPNFFEPEKPADTPDPAKRITELETELKTYKEGTHSLITDPDLYKLQEIKKSNPELFPAYMKLFSGGLDDAELWKIGFLIDHPEMKDNAEDIQRKFERTYPGLTKDPSEDEYKDAKMDLRLDAAKIKNRLMERPNAIVLPSPQTKAEDSKAAQTQLVEAWKGDFQLLAKDFVKFTEEVDLSDKIKETVNIEIPDTDRQAVAKEAAVFILVNKLEKNATNLQKVKDYMTERYFARNRKAIIAAVINQANAKRDEEWRKQTGNRSKLKSPPVSPGTVVQGQQAFVDKLTKEK